MPRCVPIVLAALVAGAALAPPPAAAQAHRNFPRTALRGQIAFGQPPEILLNGRPARLSPGARIHGLDNMIKLSGAVAGSKAIVDYTVESLGLVSEVWILRPEELAVTPWPSTPAQAAAWTFDPVGQTWTPN